MHRLAKAARPDTASRRPPGIYRRRHPQRPAVNDSRSHRGTSTRFPATAGTRGFPAGKFLAAPGTRVRSRLKPPRDPSPTIVLRGHGNDRAVDNLSHPRLVLQVTALEA